MADKFDFLSEDWVTAAKKIQEDVRAEMGPGTPPAQKTKINLSITEVPFKDGGEVEAHMDTTGDSPSMDLGHLDDAEATLIVDWATAKATMIDGNPQAGMQAFMAGKVKVQGDMTKVMALMQGNQADTGAAEAAKKLKEITAD